MLTKIYLSPSDTESEYSFDSNKIDFNNTNPKLKLFRDPSLTFLAQFTSDLNANYSRDGGSLAASAFGGIGVSGGRLQLGDTRYVVYDGVNNSDHAIQQGCIEITLYPGYTGNPSNEWALAYVHAAQNDFRNLIEVDHFPNGHLKLYMYDLAGTPIVNAFDFGIWSPVSGTKYVFSLNFDVSMGATRLFINGTQLGATCTSTLTRSSAQGYIAIGYANPYSLVGEADNFAIFDAVQHTSNYTAQDITDFPQDNPPFQAVSAVNMSKIVSLIFSTDKPSGTDIRFVIRISGIDYWFDGAEWLPSSGYSESNDNVSESQFALLDFNGLSAAFVKIYFHSDGLATPTLFSFTINYFGHGFTHIIGYMLNPDGSEPEAGQVRVTSTKLVTLVNSNAQVDKAPFIAIVGDLGKWECIIITGLEYDFSFERVFQKRIIIDGVITKQVDIPGLLQFSDIP